MKNKRKQREQIRQHAVINAKIRREKIVIYVPCLVTWSVLLVTSLRQECLLLDTSHRETRLLLDNSPRTGARLKRVGPVVSRHLILVTCYLLLRKALVERIPRCLIRAEDGSYAGDVIEDERGFGGGEFRRELLFLALVSGMVGEVVPLVGIGHVRVELFAAVEVSGISIR